MFGGYTDQEWADNGIDNFIKGNGNSFLFSLTKNTKLKCVDKEKEILYLIYEEYVLVLIFKY